MGDRGKLVETLLQATAGAPPPGGIELLERRRMDEGWEPGLVVGVPDHPNPPGMLRGGDQDYPLKAASTCVAEVYAELLVGVDHDLLQSRSGLRRHPYMDECADRGLPASGLAGPLPGPGRCGR